MSGHIRQIIPGDGWQGLFVYRTEAGTVELETRRLVCWAVHPAEDEEDDIQGYVVTDGGSYTWPAERELNFVAYLEPNENPEVFREMATEALERQEARAAERRAKFQQQRQA